MTELNDLRFYDAETLSATKDMLLAAVVLRKPTAAYAVEFQGAIVDCIAIERSPGEWIPAAVLLPESAWAATKQLSHDYSATKDTPAT